MLCYNFSKVRKGYFFPIGLGVLVSSFILRQILPVCVLVNRPSPQQLNCTELTTLLADLLAAFSTDWPVKCWSRTCEGSSQKFSSWHFGEKKLCSESEHDIFVAVQSFLLKSYQPSFVNKWDIHWSISSRVFLFLSQSKAQISVEQQGLSVIMSRV